MDTDDTITQLCILALATITSVCVIAIGFRQRTILRKLNSITQPSNVHKARPYGEGVNDALDTITLLSLEQRMVETNRTWGAMAEIVCERLSVERVEE